MDLPAEADPNEDGLFFVGDRVYTITDLASARMANMGDEDGKTEEESERISVIAYKMTAN